MNLLQRILLLLSGKAHGAIRRAEDPRSAFDDHYERQLATLQHLRRGIVEVATAKKRLEMQADALTARYQSLHEQAREAMRQGREDVARTALTRHATLEAQATDLRAQHATLAAQEQRLLTTQQELATRITAFQTEKETVKASYTAAQAQVRANAAMAGIDSDARIASEALQRARDSVTQMQARAAATDDLLISGAMADATSSPDADITRQLTAGALASSIEQQLAALRREELPQRTTYSADATTRHDRDRMDP